VITEIVEVHAEHHDGILGAGDGYHDVHQLGLAVVAAIDVVEPVGGALHLVGRHGRPRADPTRRRATRQSASSSPASDGDTAVTACASAPSTSVGDRGEERTSRHRR
jgi:hypothetical protein